MRPMIPVTPSTLAAVTRQAAALASTGDASERAKAWGRFRRLPPAEQLRLLEDAARRCWGSRREAWATARAAPARLNRDFGTRITLE